MQKRLNGSTSGFGMGTPGDPRNIVVDRSHLPLTAGGGRFDAAFVKLLLATLLDPPVVEEPNIAHSLQFC